MPTDTAVVRLVALLVSVCAAIVGAFYVASALVRARVGGRARSGARSVPLRAHACCSAGGALTLTLTLTLCLRIDAAAHTLGRRLSQWLQPVELATDGAGRLRCALLAGSAAQPQPSSAARDAEANSSDRDGGGGGSTGAGDQRVRCWAFMASALFLGLLGAIAWALALRTLSDVLRRLPTRALLDHIWAGVGARAHAALWWWARVWPASARALSRPHAPPSPPSLLFPVLDLCCFIPFPLLPRRQALHTSRAHCSTSAQSWATRWRACGRRRRSWARWRRSPPRCACAAGWRRRPASAAASTPSSPRAARPSPPPRASPPSSATAPRPRPLPSPSETCGACAPTNSTMRLCSATRPRARCTRSRGRRGWARSTSSSATRMRRARGNADALGRITTYSE